MNDLQLSNVTYHEVRAVGRGSCAYTFVDVDRNISF